MAQNIPQNNFYPQMDQNHHYGDQHLQYEHQNYSNIQPNQGYLGNNGGIMNQPQTNNGYGNAPGMEHANHDYHGNNQLLRNNSISSIDNINNFSYSEESDMLDGFNRTQSVRLYPSNMNGAITSRQNSSYESGLMDEEEHKYTPRSYMSSGSRGSNPNYNSACAQTFASSGGQGDGNNSHPQLSYDMQNMNSSFDIGNDPLYNSFQLTPRHMSDFSYNSGHQFFESQHFNSFQNYTKSQGGLYCTISNNSMKQMRNCFSVASLDGAKPHSNPSDFHDRSSLKSNFRFNKGKAKHSKDHQKGHRKKCPVKGHDEAKYTVNIDNIVEGKDSRTTLMIQNIPNKYTGKRLTSEINKTSKDKYDFFYLPIDFK